VHEYCNNYIGGIKKEFWKTRKSTIRRQDICGNSYKTKSKWDITYGEKNQK
jgi:hypothetical protein